MFENEQGKKTTALLYIVSGVALPPLASELLRTFFFFLVLSGAEDSW